jgi:hypothetical protein
MHGQKNIKFCMFLCLMIPIISDNNFHKEKWLVTVIKTMEDVLGDGFLNTLYINFML